jgi:hypothetical protein
MQREKPTTWRDSATVTPATKGQLPEATAPSVDTRSRGGSFEPIRNPQLVGFRGAPKKRKKSDK